MIGRILNMICGPVTVIADDDSAGHAIIGDPWAILHAWEQRGHFRDAKTCFRGRILTLMTGFEAEIVLLGSSDGADGADRYDIARMFESEALQPGQDIDHLEARMRRATRSLCIRHQCKIERLAEALASRFRIDDDAEIRSIAGLPDPPPEIDYWAQISA